MTFCTDEPTSDVRLRFFFYGDSRIPAAELERYWPMLSGTETVVVSVKDVPELRRVVIVGDAHQGFVQAEMSVDD